MVSTRSRKGFKHLNVVQQAARTHEIHSGIAIGQLVVGFRFVCGRVPRLSYQVLHAVCQGCKAVFLQAWVGGQIGSDKT